MRPNIYDNQDGYIALVSAIVISILLLAITFTLSFTGFYSRFNVLDSEYKKVSYLLSEACLNSAMLKLANDSSYNPSNESITVDSATGKTCTIISVGGSGQRTVRTKATYNHAVTDLQSLVTVSVSDVTLDSIKECPTTSPC